MIKPDKSLEQLLHESQNGNRESYDLFFRSVIPFLRKYVFCISRGSISQEDVLQEILLTIHRALHTYIYPNAVLPWLKAIARNKVIDQFRASLRDKILDLDKEIDGAQSLLFGGGRVPNEDLVDLKRFWAALSVQEQELLHLVKIDGYTFHQLAEQYKESEVALKVRVHRIVKKMRELALRDLKIGCLMIAFWTKVNILVLLVL